MNNYTAVTLFVLVLLGAVQGQDKKEHPSAAVVLQVAKAVGDGKSSGAPTPSSQPAAGGDAKATAGPSQQPATANPPDKKATAKAAGATTTFAAANAAWQQTASAANFNPLSNVRILSPLCPSGTEATSCASFSGNTAVVVSSVMPAIGTSTNVKTTQCFCDFRNTVNAFLPANGNEMYRCAVFCQ